ncbi:MAG: hypothetical protein IJR82_05855 [Bacilli bacterium]|nr:hypothetical protein [Bacilli bacterium]
MKINNIETKRKKVNNNKLDKIFYSMINIYFYFYFVTSLLSLIFYFTNHITLFNITTIIIIIGIIIDFLIGYTRNIFGTMGLIISSVIGICVLKDIKIGIFLGITVCTFISSSIKLIIGKIISFLIRKFN